jgi:hypothetical protein
LRISGDAQLARKLLLILAQATSGIVLTFLLANLYAYWKLRQLQQDAYRAHDRFTTGKRYTSNVNSEGRTRFGDLCAASGAQTAKDCPFWAGERTHHFQTDFRGWKTLEQLETSDYVIVGDSFLAATGGDAMTAQLGQQLKQRTGNRYYEAAHPGDPGDYIHRVIELDKEDPRARDYILLIYEGNDLAIKEDSHALAIARTPSAERPWLAAWRHASDRFLADLKNPPLFKLLAIYAESYRLQKSNHQSVQVPFDASRIYSVAGKPSAFSLDTLRVSEDSRLALPRALDPDALGYLAPKIRCLVFVPTKVSVYRSVRPTLARHPLLAQYFADLKEAGIEVLDLTEPLRQAATRQPMRPLYWSDDTHWNSDGIAVAADVMAAHPRCSGSVATAFHGRGLADVLLH